MNLSEAVRTWSIRKGNELALSGDYDLTYKKLNHFAEVYAFYINKFIHNSKQKIAILTKNNPQFIVYLLGIIRSGNIYVLINPELSKNQLSKSLEAIQCNYYLSENMVPEINQEYIPVPSFEEALNNTFLKTNMYPQIELTEDAGVIFSSGTTGEPKALMRNSYSILSEAIQWIIELQLHIGSTFLIPRPLYYTGGFILMYAVLFSGGRVDLLDDISCTSVLSYLQNKMMDWAFIVPSIIREMNILDNDIKINVSCILTMGSPIFHADKMKFHKKYECNIVEVWGNSEGLGTITSVSDLYTHPNSIGKPFFTDYLEIDYENNVNSYNKNGTLYGISDNKFTEYIGKQELTNYVLHDGFIYSEDIGYRDSNGFFYLTGRKTDIIVVNGMKVFPADIEAEIMKNKEIIDCSVMGISDEHNNDIVAAVLVVSETCISNNVIQEVNNNLAPHERIKVHILVDKIPRNHGGKPNKNILTKLINEKFRGIK